MKKRMNERQFMNSAIEKAREGIRNGQTPFGACIVKEGKVISCSHNLVWKNTDISAHAEICAIRQACRKLKTIDLSGCVIYSTCEPCPMCFSACHWARISRIVYGAGIKDAKRYGFNELVIPSSKMKQSGESPIKVKGGFLLKENLNLFKIWLKSPDKRAY